MRRFIEYLFSKLPGSDTNYTYSQKVWILLIVISVTAIITIKTVNNVIKNF